MAQILDAPLLAKVLARYVTWAKVSSAVDAVLPAGIQDDARRNYIALLAPNDLNDPLKLYRALVDDLVRTGRLDSFKLGLFNQGQGNFILREILQGRLEIDAEGNVAADKLQSLRNGTEPFLNSQTFFDGMEAARYRVCAIWVDDGITPAEIKGTGFLVAPDIVLTARHVVANLLGAGEPKIVDGNIEAPDVPLPTSETKLAFVFDYWTQASNFKPCAPPPGVSVVWPKESWLEWSSGRHPLDGISHLFAKPEIDKLLDCALVRLSTRVGAALAGHSGSRMRGWMRLNGAAPTLEAGNAIAILQYAGGGPQVFDKGNYKAVDPSYTRIWYETETTGGSSGSPCFDSTPSVVGFHQTGWPINFHGETERCNQGVRIDHVINAMPSALLDESRKGGTSEMALWSVSDDPAAPEPVLGRTAFKQAVVDLFNLRSAKRVLIVEQAAAVAPYGKSGKSFSTRILKAIARGRSGFVVEFSAAELRSMPPERFLGEVGRRIGIADLGDVPERPTDERQMARWWASDLPRWFDERLEARARAAQTAALDTAVDPATGSALGQERLLRELVWIVIDDIDRDPPEGGIKELIAGLMAITDTASLVGPGLKSLRWLVIGHIPDFVRERSIEYVRDEVSQLKIGVDEWVDCLATAFLAMGRDQFNAEATRAIYLILRDLMPDIQDPPLTLQALGAAIRVALKRLLGPGVGP